MNQIKSELGYAVLIIARKKWGKLRFKNQLKSKKWWENRIEVLINTPIINIISNDCSTYGVHDNNGKLDIPILPYEIEILAWSQAQFNDYYGINTSFYESTNKDLA